MNDFRLLNFRRFMEHPGRTLLSIAGISIGSALVVAVLGLFGSLDISVDRFVNEVSGVADLEVTSLTEEGLDETLFFDVSKTAGVKASAPMIRSPVVVGSHREGGRSEVRALLVGLDQRASSVGSRVAAERGVGQQARERLERLALRPGVLLGTSAAELLGVKQGDEVSIYSNAGERRLEVLSVLTGEAGEFNRGRFAAAILPFAQNILGKSGRLDAILVDVDDTADIEAVKTRLKKTIGTAAGVDRPSRRTDEARLITRDLRSGMLMGTAMALTVGAFLIFNTMNMAAAERRRELATLRAIGGRRRRLLVLFLLEAAALGFVGSLLGIVAGFAIAKRLITTIPAFFESAVGVEIGFHMPWYAPIVGVGSGILASVAAGFFPSRKAVTVPPVESMRPEGVLESSEAFDHVAVKPAVLGLLLAAGSFSLSVWGPPKLGFVWIGGFISGIIVVSYGLTPWIARGTSGVASRLGVAGRLAGAAIERSPRRAWATGVAVIVAAQMIVAQAGLFENFSESVQKSLGPLGQVDIFVSVDLEGFGTDAQLPGDWSDDLLAIPGVGRVGTNAFKFVTYEGNKVALQGFEGFVARNAPIMRGISDETMNRVVAGEGMIVSQRFSNLYGIEVGEQVSLPTPAGPRKLQVLGTAPSFLWDRGHLAVGRMIFKEWFRHETVGDYAIELAPGADKAEVRTALRQFVSQAPVQTYVVDGSGLLDVVEGTINQIQQLFSAMTSVVVGAAFLAILNALLISVVERRRELGIMRAIGTSRKQLRRMVGLESLALGLVGASAGAMVGLLVHRAAIAPLIEQSGFPLEYGFVLRPAIIAFLAGVGIALVGSIFPARRAARVNIIEAIGYE